MSPTFPFEFSFLRMGPCTYAAIQERYVILLDDFWKRSFEEGVWDESMAPAEWKRQQTRLVDKLLTRLASNGGAALRPEDIRLTTFAGEELPAEFLQKGATACHFEVLAQPRVSSLFAKRGSPEEKGSMYAVRWDDWYKVGWAKDPLQRMANGFWDNQHPDALCGKLGSDSFNIVGIWAGATRGDDAAFKKKFPGDVGEFFRAPRCVAGAPALLYLDKNFKRRECNSLGLPPPDQHDKSTNKRGCCTGRLHFCAKCGETFADGRKWKRHRDTNGPKCQKKAKTKHSWISFLEGDLEPQKV